MRARFAGEALSHLQLQRRDDGSARSVCEEQRSFTRHAEDWVRVAHWKPLEHPRGRDVCGVEVRDAELRCLYRQERERLLACLQLDCSRRDELERLCEIGR